MSARALAARPRRQARQGKAEAKAKEALARRRAHPTEYNMLLTATLCLLAFGAVMVFSASSTTQVLSNGGLSNSAFYLKRTLMFGAVGLVVMHLAARHGLAAIRRLTPALLASRSSSCSPCSAPAPASTAPAAGSAPARCRSSPPSWPRWR